VEVDLLNFEEMHLSSAFYLMNCRKVSFRNVLFANLDTTNSPLRILFTTNIKGSSISLKEMNFINNRATDQNGGCVAV